MNKKYDCARMAYDAAFNWINEQPEVKTSSVEIDSIWYVVRATVYNNCMQPTRKSFEFEVRHGH